MKTVLLVLEFPPQVGGVENYYGNLAKNWPDELVIIDNSEQKLLKPKAWFLKWLPSLKTIFQLINQTKPDWVIIGEILPLGTAALIINALSNFKYAIFLHGLDFSLATSTGWKKFLTKKILNKAKLIICANSYTANLVNKFLGQNNKVRVVNPGINLPKPIVRPELVASLKNNYILEDHKILLTIGRLVKRKGVADVIMVLPEILNQVPKVSYIIVGSGPEENNLRQLIQDPNLAGKVFLFNNVTEEEKWAWLELCDIFIMPTKELNNDYEGFGIVYLEANLFSKPVIATNSGGVSDAVINNVNGLLIEQNNPEILKQAILQLINNQELCAKLGQQGKNLVINEFTWYKMSQKIYQILKEIN